MKYFTITGVLLVALAAIPAVAQDQPAPEGGDRREQLQQRLVDMAERLKLTPEQKERVEPLVKQELERRRDIMAKYQGQRDLRSRRAMMQDMRSGQEDLDKQLSGILTDDQMAELRKMREENRERMRENIRQRRSQQQEQQQQ